MQELRLKTVGRFVTEWMYFYEGQAPVKDGVITLPVTPDRITWAQRAFLKGFRADPETGRILELGEILAHYENAKSEGDDTDVAEDGADSGGQSPDSDGVRSSEPQGSESVPEAGLESPVSDRPAKPAPRKRTRRRTTRTKSRG